MFETPNGFMQKMVEVGGGNSSTLQRKGPHSSIHVQRTVEPKFSTGDASWCLTMKERQHTASHQGYLPVTSSLA
jgi:hypothetical protein